MVVMSVEISANRHGRSQIQILLLLILSPILVWGNSEGDLTFELVCDQFASNQQCCSSFVTRLLAI